MGHSNNNVPKIVRPSLLPIFGRVITLFSAFMISAAIACTAWAGGISWIYDSGHDGAITVLQCPPQIYSFTGIVPIGDFCQLSLKRSEPLMNDISDYGLFTTDSKYKCIRPPSVEDPIVCNVPQACPRVCMMENDGSPCRTGEDIPATPVGEEEPKCRVVLGQISPKIPPLVGTLDCRAIRHGSYCDSTFKVTSSNSLAIRGIIVGVFVLTFIWLMAEFVLRSVDIDLRMEKAIGMARMALELPEKRAALRKSLEERWKLIEGTTSPDLDGTESQWTSNSPTSISGRGTNPGKRFTSASWKRRISQWRKLRSEKSSTFATKIFVRTMLLNLFFIGLLIDTFVLVIKICPQNISVSESWDASLIGKMAVWEFNNWADYIIFADILVDLGLFLFAAIAVKWPARGVFSNHLQDQIAAVTDKAASRPQATTTSIPIDDDDLMDYSPDGRRSIADDDDLESRSSATVSFILNQSMSNNTCLMIACHCSTMTVERCKTFAHTLRSALAVFPPSHIFVCDNGPTMHPQDETQFVAKQVHPDINYVYIPEGNKTFAFYWTNKHWIPFLTRSGVVPNFTYAVIIDDDVPLPADLHIPHQHLEKNPNIKAVHFPITATTPDGNPPTLVRCQDVEYKLAALHKLFQAWMSRSLSCHGAIALWDRQAMDDILYDCPFLYIEIFHF